MSYGEYFFKVLKLLFRFSFYGMRAILSLYLRHLLIEDGMEADQVNLCNITYKTVRHQPSDKILGLEFWVFFINLYNKIGLNTIKWFLDLYSKYYYYFFI